MTALVACLGSNDGDLQACAARTVGDMAANSKAAKDAALKASKIVLMSWQFVLG